MKSLFKTRIFLLNSLLILQVPVYAMQGSIIESTKKVALSFAKEAQACGGIIGGSIAAACVYGVLNDQVTARICPEYFSEGFHKRMRDQWHGPILGKVKSILENTQSPTVVASIWGVLASWGVGLALGVPATIAARIGTAPQLGVKDLVKPLAATLGVTAAGAAIAGTYGRFVAAKDPQIRNDFRRYAAGLTPEHALTGFITDAYAHNAAYGVGALAGLGLTGYIAYKRLQPQH